MEGRWFSGRRLRSPAVGLNSSNGLLRVVASARPRTRSKQCRLPPPPPPPYQRSPQLEGGQRRDAMVAMAAIDIQFGG